MMKFVYHLHLLDEMGDVLVSESSLFYVLLDCHLLTVKLTQKHLAIASLPDWLNRFNLIFTYQKSELNPFLLQILRHLIYI